MIMCNRFYVVTVRAAEHTMAPQHKKAATFFWMPAARDLITKKEVKKEHGKTNYKQIRSV